jgi:hypothetical protein
MSSLAKTPFASHPNNATASLANAQAAPAARDNPRAASAMLLAAIVSALLVVANQMIDAWSEGHLLAAWVVLWVVGFAALALLSGPSRVAGRKVVAALRAWREEAAMARAEREIWWIAQSDPRLMAELRSAMDRG